jgi:hypothetical protein
MKWHKGSPPHVGWWWASTASIEYLWRWWNGEVWSDPATEDASERWLNLCASRPMSLSRSSRVRWTHYWPENARVPRIDPRK